MKNKIKYRIAKSENGEITVLKPKALARDLKQLEAGEFDVLVIKRDTHLISMKRYYFSMESKLAEFQGKSKNELHQDIIDGTNLGRTVDPDTGEVVYESISDIYDIGRMMYRIVEFQEWAAREFHYTFEPYKTDNDDLLGNTELPADS